MKALTAILLSFAFNSAAAAQSADSQMLWETALAAAKREGKVVIAGSPDPVMRKEIIPKFVARFGIPVELMAGKSSEITARVRVERASRVYTVDIYMSGADTSLNVLYPEKLIDPIAPLLLLPEVTDATKWKRGKPWFMDQEEKYVLRLFNTVDSLLFINTDFVKPDEMQSAQDLLNPKWRGKIVTDDPTIESGNGGTTATYYYDQLGFDFVKKLYVDQKPMVSRDRRQFTDWLARGIYPICLTCRADDVRALRDEGFKLFEVFELEGVKSRVVSSPFLLTLANKAPHPHAAQVFVNWMASKEALEIYSRASNNATVRTDVDESFLDPRAIPRPGVDYPDAADPKWRAGPKIEAGNQIRALLRKP